MEQKRLSSKNIILLACSLLFITFLVITLFWFYKNELTKQSAVDGMVLLYVRSGKFRMGSNDYPEPRHVYPQHIVSLNAFWIDQTEVTNRMYALCVKDGACQLPRKPYSDTRKTYYNDPNFSDYPVIFVSWENARDYCKWAGRRLPTEAEWEKAARGTDGRIYPWGDNEPDSNLANFLIDYANPNDTLMAGTFPAGSSPYGALDMAGNVWEWVSDWYSDTYYLQSPSENPMGPINGKYHVLRGGSWSGVGEFNLETTTRLHYDPSIANGRIGFRCASW